MQWSSDLARNLIFSWHLDQILIATRHQTVVPLLQLAQPRKHPLATVMGGHNHALPRPHIVIAILAKAAWCRPLIKPDPAKRLSDGVWAVMTFPYLKYSGSTSTPSLRLIGVLGRVMLGMCHCSSFNLFTRSLSTLLQPWRDKVWQRQSARITLHGNKSVVPSSWADSLYAPRSGRWHYHSW